MSLPEFLLHGARPVAPSEHLQHAIAEERRLPASELEASGRLMNAYEGQGREGGAAFGPLIELAPRGGSSPLRPAAPQELLQSSPSSLPRRISRRIFVPAERCKPPYSREWLLAQRAHCDGSPLRPTALRPYPAGLRSLSASAVRADVPTAARVVPTHPQPASAPAAARAEAKPLPKDDTTPDSIHALLATLEET